LRLAHRRADIESVELHTQIADAEALPFDDGAFDIVLSTFGVDVRARSTARGR